MASAGAHSPPHNTGTVAIPLTNDEATFDGVQLRHMNLLEQKMQEDLKKRKQAWEKEVHKMKDEFLRLYPSDKQWGSEELLNDPFVRKRKGSTDVLDKRKLKTMFMEYPDNSRNFKLRFDLMDFERDSVTVNMDGDRIVVHAKKKEENDDGDVIEREYVRKIEKPKELKTAKIKAFLTTDGILVLEAPVAPNSLNLRKMTSSPSRSSYGTSSHSSGHEITNSNHSRSPSNSPGTPSNKPKEGLPVFTGVEGERQLTLIVDIGNAFKAKDVTVQIIKDNRVQVKAKHEERTSEKLSKHKFSKEYELGERIEPFSMRAALTESGKLVIGALAKGHPAFINNKTDAGEGVAFDICNSRSNKPCNVLDLANFPPSNNPMTQSTQSNESTTE